MFATRSNGTDSRVMSQRTCRLFRCYCHSMAMRRRLGASTAAGPSQPPWATCLRACESRAPRCWCWGSYLGHASAISHHSSRCCSCASSSCSAKVECIAYLLRISLSLTQARAHHAPLSRRCRAAHPTIVATVLCHSRLDQDLSTSSVARWRDGRFASTTCGRRTHEPTVQAPLRSLYGVSARATQREQQLSKHEIRLRHGDHRHSDGDGDGNDNDDDNDAEDE